MEEKAEIGNCGTALNSFHLEGVGVGLRLKLGADHRKERATVGRKISSENKKKKKDKNLDIERVSQAF
jgi:hypothetical protein